MVTSSDVSLMGHLCTLSLVTPSVWLPHCTRGTGAQTLVTTGTGLSPGATGTRVTRVRPLNTSLLGAHIAILTIRINQTLRTAA